MNATVQALRAMPELQSALEASLSLPTDTASVLRDLFAVMDRANKTKGTVTPTNLLQQLREAVTQSGETHSNGTQFAQQG